jgi:hypothetical protein
MKMGLSEKLFAAMWLAALVSMALAITWIAVKG